VKSSAPGRTINITPTNPTKIADIRRHPMGSPKNSAAASVMVSGSACKIAVTLAMGMLNSAVRKKYAAPISPTMRKAMLPASRRETRANRTPIHHATTATAMVVKIPRRNSTWNNGISPASAFMKVSLIVKLAIEAIIRIAPVRLSDRAIAAPVLGWPRH